MNPRNPRNPFYVVLILAGILFVVTACAFLTMTVREANPRGAAPSQLMTFVARHGLTALLAELFVLAGATFAAIGTDDYWRRRALARNLSDESSSTGSSL